jgi:hypothetical protein
MTAVHLFGAAMLFVVLFLFGLGAFNPDDDDMTGLAAIASALLSALAVVAVWLMAVQP